MSVAPSSQTLTKGDFARLINVSPGRISQYISSGQIGPDALEGSGRSARIIVERAKRHLNSRLDVSQRVGLNGITTNIAAQSNSELDLLQGSETLSSAPTFRSAADVTSEQIALEKLEQAKMQTARARREEALAEGRYILAGDAKAEIGRAVSMAYRVMEGGLADMATHLAGQFELPQRDFLHHLQRAFRDVREHAAQGFKDNMADEPVVVEDSGEVDDI